MVLSVPISPVGVAACRHDQTACRQLLCDRCCLRGSHSARSCRFPLCFTSPRPSGDTEALQYRPLQHRVKSLRLNATTLSGGGQRNEAPSSCRCVHGSLEPFLAVTGDASGLATCSNMLLYCAEHHATLCGTGGVERAPQASARRQGQWHACAGGGVERWYTPGPHAGAAAGPARGSAREPGEREEVAVQLRRQRACWRQFVLGGRLQAWSAEAVAALETRMVDASGSGLGGMRVWAHDSAVAHVVLLVPHGPRFGDLNRGASRSGYEWP